VADGLDVAALIRVDRANRHPVDGPPLAQAHGDHLDLEGEPVLAAVQHRRHEPAADQPIPGLVVRDPAPESGGDGHRSQAVGEPPDEGHATEAPTADDQLAGLTRDRAPGVGAKE
jgi:hypothetical protein